jgi:hypothetical protein
MSAYLGVSRVSGDSLAIRAQQLSPRRYYQRPDADHVELDPSRTSLTGVTAGINHSKLAGNWRWDIDYILETPGLELNDMGALGSADDMGVFSDIYYRRTRPGPILHNWTVGLAESAEWNVGGTRTFSAFGLFGETTLKNFWQVEFDFNYVPQALSDNLTRGGPLMRTPRAWQLGLELGGRDGARTSWRIETFNRWDELNGSNAEAEGTLVFRPGTQWEVSIEPTYSRVVTPRQYVASRSGGGSATYGRRYIFARLERSEIVTQLRLSYAVQPDLTVEVYVEPFASSGRYTGFGELETPQTFHLRRYDPLGIARNGDSVTVTDGASTFSFDEPDFDARSLRSNVVVRWEWRPGSTLFLVWQQDRSSEGLPTRNVGPRGLWEAFSVPGDQFLALKVSYWIPVR